MNIEIKSIKIDGFMDLGSDNFIEFPKMGITGIFGKNNDTGSSNGAGKTSFIKACCAAIYGIKSINLSNKDIKNRNLDINPQTEIYLQLNGEDFYIKRSFGGKISYKEKGGDWESGKAEDVERYISSRIQLTLDQFLILSTKYQDDQTHFLTMKDSKKKDLLSSFFDLSFVDTLEETAKNKLLEITEEHNNLTNSVLQKKARSELLNSILNNTLNELNVELSKKQNIDNNLDKIKGNNLIIKTNNEKINEIEKNEILVDRGAILAIENNLVDLNNKKNTINEEKLKLSTKIQKLLEKDRENKEYKDRIHKLDKELLTIEAKSRSINNDILTINSIIKQLEAEEKSLSDLIKLHKLGKCFTCGKKYDSNTDIHGNSLEFIQEKEKRLNALSEEISTLKNELKQKENILLDFPDKNAIEREINDISAILNNYNISELGNFLEKEKEYSHVISMIDNEIHKATASIQKIKTDSEIKKSNKIIELKNINNNLEKENAVLQQEYDYFISTISRIKKSIESNKEDLDKMLANISTLESSLEISAQKVNDLNMILKSTSRTGFIGYIFDGILQTLNHKVYQNTQMIELIKDFRIVFDSSKTTKTTNAQVKSINYTIYKGSDTVELDTLSGAEKLCLVLAVDEALIETLSERTGIYLRWRFLDEQLMYVDNTNKQDVLDFLYKKSYNKLYLIVDHASEINASINNKIVIEKTNGIASILT